jgi:predicted ATPase
MITRVEIQHYRRFNRFSLELRPGLNILVGDNDSGKSTVLEAIRVALTGRLGERFLANALTPHLFHSATVDAYVAAIHAGNRIAPPEFIIDVFLDDEDATVDLRGTNNLLGDNEPGLRIKASFNRAFREEYLTFIAQPDDVRLVPVEYYQVEWLSFAGNPVTARSVPASVARVDASSIRLQSGADYYMQRIIEEHLDPKERVELSRAYRSLREGFSEDAAIVRINEALAASDSDLTDRDLSLAIDVSHRTAWEASLVPHLDDLPFHFVGHGTQSSLKILLGLNRSADDSHVVLVEEPENHLSPASLNALVRRIEDRCAGKQLVISTHSSFVLNKLGLDNLVLMSDTGGTRLTQVPPDTLAYFKKLSGYDTLRLVLARKAILVEGPSDELLVQRAHLDRHKCLPMQAGIDVINVRGLSFKRFLDVARLVGCRVAVVTDLDKRTSQQVADSYADYTKPADDHTPALTSVHPGIDGNGTTLEPQVAAVNDLATLNKVFGTTCHSKDEIVEHMTADKTGWALRFLETKEKVTVPQYIHDAIDQ